MRDKSIDALANILIKKIVEEIVIEGKGRVEE